MKRLFFALLVLPFALSTPAQAQDGFGEEFLAQLQSSGYKLVALAEAVPADQYGFKLTPESMSIEQVFTHIARYNYMYLAENMDMPAPEGVDYANMEDLTGKEDVLNALKSSFEHLRHTVKGMSAEDFAATTELYGRQTTKWGVLFQLDSHMSEHQGQVIAYGRAAGVTPPWSR